jgi:hypothetical protein
VSPRSLPLSSIRCCFGPPFLTVFVCFLQLMQSLQGDSPATAAEAVQVRHIGYAWSLSYLSSGHFAYRYCQSQAHFTASNRGVPRVVFARYLHLTFRLGRHAHAASLGYPRSTSHDLRQVAEYVNGASFQAISSIAKAQHAAIVYGYAEKTAESTHLYNSLVCVHLWFLSDLGRPLLVTTVSCCTTPARSTFTGST